jgi:hypothetical protein
MKILACFIKQSRLLFLVCAAMIPAQTKLIISEKFVWVLGYHQKIANYVVQDKNKGSICSVVEQARLAKFEIL